MRSLRLTFVMLIPLLLVSAMTAVGEEQAYDTPHQRAFACFGNQDMTFADDPADCDAVCSVCHTGESVASGDAAASFALIYTLTYAEAVTDLSAADLAITGGEFVTGSLAKIDETTWTFKVKPAGSVTDVGVALNNGKSAVITRKLQTARMVEGQSQNPELLWTDMVYPGLYPNVSGQLSSSNTDEQNWEALPALHKICRECHPTQSEAVHNHPLFVKMAVDFGNGTTEEMGLLLCATCHDPHSNKLALLRMENSGSQLCQYCHGK